MGGVSNRRKNDRGPFNPCSTSDQQRLTKMTFQQELNSWWSPNAPETAEVPQVGSKALNTPKLQLEPGRPAILTFLRHCGCPFAEKTFLNFREIAKDNKDLDFIAVSHSDEEATTTWLRSLPQAGSEPSNLRIVVDDKVEIYAAWGLGISSFAHTLSPASMYSVWKLGRTEGVWNRPTESGSRWQTAGTYSVDGDGVVRWGGPAQRADDIPDLEAAVQSVRGEKSGAKL
ncbi:uncharacterized protein LTR77_000679 [Saxophila tyrrhenica]|uniref:Thioredoxin domain-containing protein n=1 Tax=Saxophila tyrrhenica TaxID=1690608 RepID=A0AAV9PS20_9PEZI|nr:hypothetical protein LTR77_000679 [Saxophila tyrrhenica]